MDACAGHYYLICKANKKRRQNLALVMEALRRSRSGLLLLVYLVLIFMVIMSRYAASLEQ
jgi:hypothetical protein